MTCMPPASVADAGHLGSSGPLTCLSSGNHRSDFRLIRPSLGNISESCEFLSCTIHNKELIMNMIFILLAGHRCFRCRLWRKWDRLWRRSNLDLIPNSGRLIYNNNGDMCVIDGDDTCVGDSTQGKMGWIIRFVRFDHARGSITETYSCNALGAVTVAGDFYAEPRQGRADAVGWRFSR